VTSLWLNNLAERQRPSRRRQKLAFAFRVDHRPHFGHVVSSQVTRPITARVIRWPHPGHVVLREARVTNSKAKAFLVRISVPCAPSNSISLAIPLHAQLCTRLSSLLVGSVPHVKENCQSTREPPRRPSATKKRRNAWAQRQQNVPGSGCSPEQKDGHEALTGSPRPQANKKSRRRWQSGSKVTFSPKMPAAPTIAGAKFTDQKWSALREIGCKTEESGL